MTKEQKALKLALEALEEPHPGIRTNLSNAMTHREKIKTSITVIREALAQPAQELNNFCPRCGKRLQGVLGQPQVHTCTPPLWGHT